jgi:hypothetical protein
MSSSICNWGLKHWVQLPIVMEISNQHYSKKTHLSPNHITGFGVLFRHVLGFFSRSDRQSLAGSTFGSANVTCNVTRWEVTLLMWINGGEHQLHSHLKACTTRFVMFLSGVGLCWVCSIAHNQYSDAHLVLEPLMVGVLIPNKSLTKYHMRIIWLSPYISAI